MRKWTAFWALAIGLALAFGLNISGVSAWETSPGWGAGDDWVTINKDYSSQRFVNLDQITPANVKNLKEVCEIQLNEPVFFSSGLLKVGRTLYVSTYDSTVAFDAATCDLRWRSLVAFQQIIASINSRGVGYEDGKIFRGTADGRVIALDAATGKTVWDVQAAYPSKKETFNSAPIVWQGKVFIGIAVSDDAIAGRLMAFDAKNGNQLWAFNTTLGFIAGGGMWTSYSLDPRTGELFDPVANPYPDLNRDITPGDKTATMYTNSVISVDAANGHLNWHYQAVPYDEHDWDLTGSPTLYRTPDGKEMLAVAGKSGRVFGLDRQDQKLVFNTPGTTLENDQVPLNGSWMHVCPGLQGGSMFNGTAYNPRTNQLFTGMNDHCAWYIKNAQYPGGGSVFKDFSAAAKLMAPTGWITALNGDTGSVLWQYHAESQVQAGLLPTKSGLLFAGDTHGNLLAFESNSGKLLNSIDVKGAMNSGLISYEVDGEQYLAASVGGATENPSKVAGALRVSIYSLRGRDTPKIVQLDRLPPAAVPGLDATEVAYAQNCGQCHGNTGGGSSAPPLTRQSQLADPDLLKAFLQDVLPPMPHLYPSVLNDEDVKLIAKFLRKKVFNCGPNELQRCKPPEKPHSGGTYAWKSIYSVLTSPRCINCHTIASKLPDYGTYPQDYPRQGDDRHPHYYGVLRGDLNSIKAGIGTPVERCVSCHGANNDPVDGIPGAHEPDAPDTPFWSMAPSVMTWETAPGVPMNGSELCAQIKDPTRNGGRSLQAVREHISNEPLVNWAWHPGTRLNGEARTTPPISQQELVRQFSNWMNANAPCPADGT